MNFCRATALNHAFTVHASSLSHPFFWNCQRLRVARRRKDDESKVILHNIKVAGSHWLCNRCTPSSDIYLNLSYKTSRAAFCEASNRRSLVCTRIARSRVQSLLLSELHQPWNWKPQTDVDGFVQGRVHGYAGRHHGTECRWLLQWLPQVKNVDKHMNRT